MIAPQELTAGVLMSEACRECGGELFTGETRCPVCGSAVAGPASIADAPGWLDPHAATPAGPPPPPEGLQLIIDKHRADQARTYDEPTVFEELGAHALTGRGFDLGEAMAPTYDREGKVEFDLKYAIWGAVIIAVLVGIAAAYIFGGLAGGSHISRVSR